MSHEDALKLIEAVNGLRLMMIPLTLAIFSAAIFISSAIREKK